MEDIRSCRKSSVTTTPHAGLDLHDGQIAARHAGPRTTTRDVRAREDLDRHPDHVLAAYVRSRSNGAAGQVLIRAVTTS